MPYLEVLTSKIHCYSIQR